MPRIIVIAGGGRNLGKTHLRNALGAILPGSAVVKLGHHPAKSEKHSNYFPKATALAEIVSRVGNCEFLIIESGSILDESGFEPDLVIFLPALDGADKPGSERVRSRAHLVRGEQPAALTSESLKKRLGLDDQTWTRLMEAVMRPIPSRSLPLEHLQ